MALRKVIFDNANVIAKDFGAAFAGICADGRIVGANVTYSGGTVGIGVGYIVACGRIIENTTPISVTPTGTGFAQIVLVLNVSAGTVTVETRTAETDSFTLTKENINDGSSTTYEVEVAAVNLTEGTLIRSMGMAARPVYVVNASPTSGAADGIYFVTE